MEKNGSTSSPRRRSVGVTIVGIGMLIYSILNLIFPINFYLRLLFIGSPYKSNFFYPNLHFILLHLSYILLLILYLIASIGILRIRGWSRRFAIYISIIILLCSAIRTILPALNSIITESEGLCDAGWCGLIGRSLLFIIAVIKFLFPVALFLLYLTRPKVKRAFSERNPERAKRVEG